MEEEFVRHGEPSNPGLAGLVVIAYLHGVPADASQLAHQLGTGSKPCSDEELLAASRLIGLKARLVQLRPERLTRAPLPALMLDRDGRHFVLARLSNDGGALVQEGGAIRPSTMSLQLVLDRTAGRAILFTSRASVSGELARFDFSWFVPALVKYRRYLLEVLLISVVLQLLGLVSPLMFQAVMDKVLVNRAFNTLTVICLAMFVSAIAEVVLSGLRDYILAHTTTRIDVELGARLFRHLLNLPLGYFTARRTGDTITRVREVDTIRNFLTGQALTSVIDLFFSLLIVSVMFSYSTRLTLIVVASLPAYAAVSFVLNPMFRLRLDRKFARYSDSQSHLVESVAGVEAVKSMAVEPQFVRRWDQQLASYVAASFQVTTLANIGQQLIQLINKLVTIATLFFGAQYVVDGHLTVGGLVAFNMMSQRVTGPVLRLAQLWQDLQQVGLSIQRLGDVLNAKSELVSSTQALSRIGGAIRFDGVNFRYSVDTPLVLKRVSFTIEPGQVVGIVGRSGSGKSTVAKLLQKLYVPESGRITIDSHDLALADPAWLRRQIGVVSQESILFNRSIRENISLADPGMSLDQVIAAAELAGIHDFIAELPRGYDTAVGELGSGLSGGQKQRIAIARALIRDPRILIFDEATSALDYETERILQSNMKRMTQGRTVIIIAHRLSAVHDADVIIAMDDGQIVEMDARRALLERNGYFARLVASQGQPA